MTNKPSNIKYELSIIADQLSKKLDKISTDEIIKKLIYFKKSEPNEIKVYNYLSLFYNKSSKYLKAINCAKQSIRRAHQKAGEVRNDIYKKCLKSL